MIDWRPSAPEPGKDYSGVPQASSPAALFEFPVAYLPVIILTQ